MQEVDSPFIAIIALLAVVALLFAALRAIYSMKWTMTVPEGSRGLIHQHGKFEREVRPGRHWMIFGRTMQLVAINEQTIGVQGQEVMTSDRLAVRMTALATFRIVDPRVATQKSAGGHYQPAYYAVQLALRAVVAELTLEALLDQRASLDEAVKVKAAAAFTNEGCELLAVAIRDLTLPAEVRRLATDITRAKLEAAASLERARGEQASLRALANAARLIKGNPELMNLRVLQALTATPGKAAPTIILGGSAGIVPVPAGSGDTPPEASDA